MDGKFYPCWEIIGGDDNERLCADRVHVKRKRGIYAFLLQISFDLKKDLFVINLFCHKLVSI